MRRALLLAACVLLLGPSVWADDNSGPLLIKVPTDWKLEYDNSKGINFYSLTRPGEMFDLLMFSRTPQYDLPKPSDFVDQVADSMEQKAKDDPASGILPDCTKGDIKGGSFSGRFALFRFKHKVVQSMFKNGMVLTVFVIGDGHDDWQGQYAGSDAGWDEALQIIVSLKKNASP